MSRSKRIKGCVGFVPWMFLATAPMVVGRVAPASAAERSAQISAITAEEQPDGRTRLTIKASVKPTFTSWKMEHPSRVVVDVTGVALNAAEVPFDAGTFAVGNVTAGAQAGKTRITMTLRRSADYQVEARGNVIVVDVTPWEAPPVVSPSVDPQALALARSEAEKAARARAEAETRAQRAEEDARRVASDRNAAANEARARAEEAAQARADAEARAQRAEEEVRRLASDRNAAATEARNRADEANNARLQAEARAARAEQEARRLAAEKQQSEEARRLAAEQARRAAEFATQTLAAQKAALEESRARAEAAQLEAQRMAATLAAERAAVERARKGVEAAEKASVEASRIAADGQRKEERLAAERAASHLARERDVLERRRQQAEANEQAAAVAMQKLAEQKREVEQRQQHAEAARLAAAEAAKRLQTDRETAAAARTEAERLRAEAEATERKARALLASAQAAQKQAEARQQQSERAGRKNDADATAAVAEARRQTEQARASAVAAESELRRLEAQRKQLAAERENLNQQQAALADAERQALAAHQRAAEITAKAADVQAAMARLEQEKQALASQQKALAEKQAQLALVEKQTAARRADVEAKAAAQHDEAQRLRAFEKSVDAQKSALAQTSVEQERQSQRLLEAERQLAAAKLELEARERALTEAQKRAEQTTAGHREAQSAKSRAERAKLEEAKAELARALSAHAEAESDRQAQENKLAVLVSERQSLEQARGRLERELATLKSELEGARAEVARLKATPPAAPTKAPAPAPQPARVEAPVADVVYASAPQRTRSITLRVPSRVSRIDFVDEPARSSVIIDLEEPTDFSVERSTGRRVTLRLHHADLPKVLERSMDATQFFGPVRLINSFRDPGQRGAVLVEVELAEMVPNRVRTDGSRLYWDFDKSRPGSAASLPTIINLAAARVAGFSTSTLPLLVAQDRPVSTSQRAPTSKKRFTGRRIDLDFKGADIHNILRLLAEVGGVNIVTSDDVKGEVTIKMRDVPWDQALDVVLRAKTLGQIREGNLIRVAPIQVLEKELEQEIAKQKQMTEVMPTETRLIGVSYAEAKELEARAKDLLSARGKVSVDDRTNNLIVSDVAKNLALVEELVRNLDTQTSQVVIEARIVEARSTFVRQIGVQWGGTSFMDAEHGNPTGLAFPNAVGIGGGATDQLAPTGGLVPGPRTGSPNLQSPNYAVNLPAAVGTGSGGALGLTLGSVAGALNLNLRLSALEQSGQVRILSSPRISTMDNVQASIEQGVAIPISVVSAQGVQTVFVDAKLNLTVKPHVTNEGTVILNVHVTRNEPDFVNTGARGDPTILKKEAKTVMLVRDGDTAVIGGIYQRNSGLNYSKVPFFADIPIIGFFFRNRRENDDRTEFLVFITPRIANRSRALSQ